MKNLRPFVNSMMGQLLNKHAYNSTQIKIKLLTYLVKISWKITTLVYVIAKTEIPNALMTKECLKTMTDHNIFSCPGTSVLFLRSSPHPSGSPSE